MSRLFADTSQLFEDELLERLNQVSPRRKIEIVAQLNAATRALMMSGLRRQFPDISPEQRQYRLAATLFTDDLARQLHSYLERISPMQPEPIAVMIIVANLFNQLGIPYVIGGSMASALYGVGRATLDVDFVASIRDEHIVQLVKSLRPAFYLDEQMIHDAIAQRGSFNLIHLPTLFKVDVFIPGARPFDRLQLERRVGTALTDEPGQVTYFLSAEDVILAKLDWFNLGRGVSDRQWQDILGVLVAQASQLDLHYMRRAAATLGVNELLSAALAASGYE